MKFILFCKNNYAFGILNPIKEYIVEKNYSFLWYVDESIFKDFPYSIDPFTTSIYDLNEYNCDVIFVPGNEVPYYLRGLKVQVFHGLAGEKKGHFRIRHYFDLYLTQGPYFTDKFNQLKEKYGDFEVIETGWPKLDVFATELHMYDSIKKNLLEKHKVKYVLLYAPTFSPKLTSAPFLMEQLNNLAKSSDYLILLKFHPLMDESWVNKYKDLSNNNDNIIFQEEKNIVKFLLMADLLISDTSSVIYEFLLLDKPVVSFRNISEEIYWDNSEDYKTLAAMVERNLIEDSFSSSRKFIFQNYHPYKDGKSAMRIVDTVQKYISKHGVPNQRNISFTRRLKIHSIFGKPPLSISKSMIKLSAVIITFNEEEHLEKCLESLNGIADEIVVVDSFSTDSTKQICKKYNVKFVEQKFLGYIEQKNFAITQTSHNYILSLDGDEALSDALKNSILKLKENWKHDGYYTNRRNNYCGQWIKHSDWYPDKKLRLFKKSKGEWRGINPHDSYKLFNPKSSGKLKGDILHWIYRDYIEHNQKVERFSTIASQAYFELGKKSSVWKILYRPAWAFLKSYFLRLGFLDGLNGLIICIQTYNVTFLKYIKLYQLQKKAKNNQ